MNTLGLLLFLVSSILAIRSQHQVLLGFPRRNAFDGIKGKRFRAQATLNGTKTFVTIVVNDEFTYIMDGPLTFLDFAFRLKNKNLIVSKTKAFIGYRATLQTTDWEVEHFFKSVEISISKAKQIQKSSGGSIEHFCI